MALSDRQQFTSIWIDSLKARTRHLPRSSIRRSLGRALGRTPTADLLQLTVQHTSRHQILRFQLLLNDLFPLVQLSIGPVQRTLRARPVSPLIEGHVRETGRTLVSAGRGTVVRRALSSHKGRVARQVMAVF